MANDRTFKYASVLTEDLDTLRDLTAQSVTHSLEHVADEIEDFLKKGTTNDDA